MMFRGSHETVCFVAERHLIIATFAKGFPGIFLTFEQVWGKGVVVQGLGFRVLGFRVQGLLFRVWGSSILPIRRL